MSGGRILLWGPADPAFSGAFIKNFDYYLYLRQNGLECHPDRDGNIRNIIVDNCSYCNLPFEFIVVKGSDFDEIPVSFYGSDTVFVFESSCSRMNTLLKQTGNRSICYGPSHSDSITFSSVEDDCVTVFVQQGIQYRGKSIDMEEFSIRNCDPQHIFAGVCGTIISRLVC